MLLDKESYAGCYQHSVICVRSEARLIKRRQRRSPGLIRMGHKEAEAYFVDRLGALKPEQVCPRETRGMLQTCHNNARPLVSDPLQY